MTRQEAKAAGLVAVTVDEQPRAVVQTAYGDVPWSEWCKREMQRLHGVGRKAEIVSDAKGWAVWATPVQPLPPQLPSPV